MSLRAATVALIVLATIGFVVGTTIERNTTETHPERPPATRAEGSSTETHAEGGAESESRRAAETGERSEGGRAQAGGRESGRETHAELKPLGVDIEAVPFVVLAVLASLALAFAVWSRPRSLAVLGVVAAAMLLFAVLDVREVFHQVDESRAGLAVLAGVVAALHLAAAMTAGVLARRGGGPVRPVGTMPA